MRSSDIIACLECNPVIAAIQNDKWESALESPVDMIFYLSADLLTVKDRVAQAHEAGKYILVHMDLAEGLGKDKPGLVYVKKMGVDGVISTRVNIIKAAREAGLFTVQRFFIVDSHSVNTTLEAIKSSHPDMIEIMPGIVTKVIADLKASLNIPIIAGGLIETRKEIEEAVHSGASGISTSRAELWGRKEKS